jgi:hypothetical protein
MFIPTKATPVDAANFVGHGLKRVDGTAGGSGAAFGTMLPRAVKSTLLPRLIDSVDFQVNNTLRFFSVQWLSS